MGGTGKQKGCGQLIKLWNNEQVKAVALTTTIFQSIYEALKNGENSDTVPYSSDKDCNEHKKWDEMNLF